MHDVTNDNGQGNDLVFEKNVREILDKEIKTRLLRIWTVISAFGLGFLLFVGAGLTWKDNLLKPLIESTYPPLYILEQLPSQDLYSKVKNRLVSDSSLASRIFDEEHRNRIARQVVQRVSDQVDSGYTKTIIFSKEGRGALSGGENVLMFHARPDQQIEVTILAHSNNRNAKFRVTLDKSPWGEAKSFSYFVIGANVTSLLRFDVEPGGNLHHLRFTPENLFESDDVYAVIDCVVLVKHG